MSRICAKEKFDKKVFDQKELRYKESLPCSRATYADICLGPGIENFHSDLEEANSLPSSLKNWLESTISMSRTTSQDSHLCSNPTTTVTDGASERSSEKSYKIVTHDDFFIADETAGMFSRPFQEFDSYHLRS